MLQRCKLYFDPHSRVDLSNGEMTKQNKSKERN